MKHYGTIILFGDSNTEYSFQVENNGWGAQLSNAFARKMHVLNYGFSGYNSEVSKIPLEHIVQLCQQLPPNTLELVTVAFGSNDSADANLNSVQHVPLQTYSQNMKKLLTDLLSLSDRHPQMRILLFTPPPVYPEDWLKALADRGEAIPECDRSNASNKKYAIECEEVVKVISHPRLRILDLYELFFEDALKRGLKTLQPYFIDGLHYSPLGNNLVFNSIMEMVVKEWPEMDPVNVPFIYPYWKDICSKKSSGLFQ